MESQKPDKCVLCGENTKDELMGPLLQKNGLAVHNHCLLLTHGLSKNGQSSSGINGFYLKDIRKAANKCKKYKCFYCRLPKANMMCWSKKCTRRFHFSCGLKKNCKTRFGEHCVTYCHSHAYWRFIKKPGPQDICVICTDPFIKPKPSDCLLAYCCKSGWFHKRCISKYANVSGHFFKCPLCKNIDRFRKGMENNGVFVTKCDGGSDVDSDDSDYSDILSEEILCTADLCFCFFGRAYEGGIFELIPCTDCGSNDCHLFCMHGAVEEYKCSVCRVISENIQ